MRASLLLCLVAAFVGAVRADCVACIHGQCYRKHRLPGITSGSLEIDRNTNTLYSTDGKSLTQCHLDTGLCNKIPNTKEIWSYTVDQHTGASYGRRYDDTGNSMYQFDLLNSDKNVLLVRDGVDYVTFKDKLYYSAMSDLGIFTYEDGESRLVPGSEEYEVSNFIVDKNNDIYFLTYTFINPVKRLSNGVVDKIQNGVYNYITVDKDGNGILINKETHVIYRVTDGIHTEIGAIDDSVTNLWYHPPLFDRDNNIIYQMFSNEYYHLKRDSRSSCTVSYLQYGFNITENAVATGTHTENNTISTKPLPYANTATNSSSDAYTEDSETTNSSSDAYTEDSGTTTSSSDVDTKDSETATSSSDDDTEDSETTTSSSDGYTEDIETTTSSTDGNTEEDVAMSTRTPISESTTSSSAYKSDTSLSGAPGQHSNQQNICNLFAIVLSYLIFR